MEKKAKVYVKKGKVIVEVNGDMHIVNTLHMWRAITVAHEFTNIRIDRSEYAPEIIRYKWRQVQKALGGVTASALAKQINSKVMGTYIVPNQKLLNRLGRLHGGRRLPILEQAVIRNLKAIKEYEKDGLSHLSGFGLLNLNSKRAKELFGKNLWKKLCSNSMTRNDYICKFLYFDFTSKDVWFKKHRTKGMVAYYARKLNELPTTILSRHSIARKAFKPMLHESRNFLLEALEKERSEENISLNDFVKNHYAIHRVQLLEGIICDTANNLEKLGLEFNGMWSFNRIREEHDRASDLLAAQKYSKENFPYVDSIQGEFRANGLTARLVRSPYDLYKVGRREHHCVHTYADLCWNKEYVVFEIEKDGKFSTLGFGAEGKHYVQHMYACNNPVTDDKDRIELAKFIVKHVRKHFAFHKANDEHYGGANAYYNNMIEVVYNYNQFDGDIPF